MGFLAFKLAVASCGLMLLLLIIVVLYQIPPPFNFFNSSKLFT
jgi:hypothetical protein